MYSILKTRNTEQERNNSKIGGWVYSKEWIRPYESIWSIVQSFKYVNILTEHEICTILNLQKKHKDAYASEVCAYIKTNVSPQELLDAFGIEKNHFSPLNSIDIHAADNFMHSSVRICPVCMKQYTYHSFYHQISWLQKCPWHGCDLEMTNIPYSIGESCNYAYGICPAGKKFSAEIPLPANRERFEPNYVNIPELSNAIKFEVSRYNGSTYPDKFQAGELLLQKDDDVKEKYLRLLRDSNIKLYESDITLKMALNQYANIARSSVHNIASTYGTNYFVICYLNELIRRYAAGYSYEQIILEDISEFFKNEAIDPLRAAITFAINLTETGEIFYALNKWYYLHPHSRAYKQRWATMKSIYIDSYFEYSFFGTVLAKSILNDTKILTDICLNYEVLTRLLDCLWNQYLSMLNKGLAYRDLSKHLKYPFFILKETVEEEWYLYESF